MCYRKQLWGAVLIALGAGFILSSFFAAVFVRMIVGIILLLIGLSYVRHY